MLVGHWPPVLGVHELPSGFVPLQQRCHGQLPPPCTKLDDFEHTNPVQDASAEQFCLPVVTAASSVSESPAVFVYGSA